MYVRNYLPLRSIRVHPRTLAFCVEFCRLLFVLFRLAIAMSIHLFKDSYYPFGIFTLLVVSFLCYKYGETLYYIIIYLSHIIF